MRMSRGQLVNIWILSVIVATAAHGQQNPNGQIPVTAMQDPYLILIRDPVVHGQLELNAEQIRGINALTDQLDLRLWPLRNKPNELAAPAMEELIDTARGRLGQTLTATQQKRLTQIELRVAGVKALLRDDVSDGLGLSESQRSRIQQLLEEFDKASDDSSRSSDDGQGDGADQRSRADVAASDLRTQLWEMLSPEQRKRMAKQFGPPIDISRLGYVRFKAPELDDSDGRLNSTPQTLAQLRGQVVAVHFWAFGCINCIRNYPWYRNWHEAFADRGLTIIGIHTPETKTEQDRQKLQEKVAEARFEFPILIDNDRRNWNAWGNAMWPTVYLIDKQGDVRYWWIGELNWQGARGEELLRGRIEELLSE